MLDRVLETVSREAICRAIRERRRLTFRYGGRRRVVEPYCHGTGTNGRELLRAVQVGGETGTGFGFGKLWRLDRMSEVAVSTEPAAGDDPSYNPDDSAFSELHCRLQIEPG